jgi:hypothetical protein
MKKTLSIVLVLVIVIGGFGWYFVTHRMDGMIKEAIETSASASFGTAVSVGSLKTNIKEGSMTISSITVANPPGYKSRNAFTLNGIEAAVDYETYDIKRVVVDKPEIVIEEKGGGSNFSELLAGMEEGEPEPTETAEGEEPPTIVIHYFRMNESRAAFESKSFDTYSELEIDAVELSNVKGTPDEVASTIANAVINEVVAEAAREILKAKASEKMDSILGRDKD